MGSFLMIDSPTDQEYKEIISYLERNNNETLIQFLQFSKHQQWRQSDDFIENYLNKLYQSKLEVSLDLQKYFSIQNNEKCIESFSCGFLKNIILQGLLYIWKDKLCFHSYFNDENLFFGQTHFVINIDEIIRIEKKSYAFIDSGICVITADKKEHNFVSFWSRNKAFEMLQTILRLTGKLFEIDEQTQLANASKFIKEIINYSNENNQEFYANSTSTINNESSFSEIPSSSNQQTLLLQEGIIAIQNQTMKNECNLLKLEQLNLNLNPMKKFNQICDKLEKLEEIYLHQFNERKEKIKKLIYPIEKYKIKKQLVLENCTIKQFYYYFLSDHLITCYNGKNYNNFQELFQEQVGDKNIIMGNWTPNPITYFNEPENNNIKQILTNYFFTSRTVNYEHQCFEKNSFTPEFITTTENHKLYFVSPFEIWIESSINLGDKIKFHDCILPRKLTIYKQNINDLGQFEIEFIKTTIFFNGIIEKQGNKEFEQTFNNKYKKIINDIWNNVQHKEKQQQEQLLIGKSEISDNELNDILNGENKEEMIEQCKQEIQLLKKQAQKIQNNIQKTHKKIKSLIN